MAYEELEKSEICELHQLKNVWHFYDLKTAISARNIYNEFISSFFA